MRCLARTAVLLILAPAALTAQDKPPPADVFDARHVSWTRLEFRAKKLFLSARSQVSLRAVPDSEADAGWIASPRGTAVEADESGVLEVAIDSTLAGRRSTNSVWFEPRRAAALQLAKQRHGKKPYRKDGRFTDAEIYILRTAPGDDAQVGKPFSEWTKVQEFFYPHPDGHDCRVLSEPAVLFYMLSASSLPMRSEQICVFSRKRVIPLTIETVGSERLAVDYEEISSSARRRQGEVEVWRIAVRPRGEGEDIELLGLDGDIEIFLEKTSRVPVQVRGKIRRLGRVAIKLSAVELGHL